MLIEKISLNQVFKLLINNGYFRYADEFLYKMII